MDNDGLNLRDRLCMLFMAPIFIVFYPFYCMSLWLEQARREMKRRPCPGCGKRALGAISTYTEQATGNHYEFGRCSKCGESYERTNMLGEDLLRVQKETADARIRNKEFDEYMDGVRAENPYASLSPISDTISACSADPSERDSETRG